MGWQKRSWRRIEEHKEGGKLETPLLFVLHVTVAVLITVKIAAVVHEDTPFIVASRGTFTDMFLRDGVTREGNVGYLYEINQCITSVNRSIQTYYDLPSVGLDVYDALTKPIMITVIQMRDNPHEVLPKKEKWKPAKGRNSYFLGDLETRSSQVNVTSKSDNWLALLGVNSTRGTRLFFNSLVQMELLFQVRTLHRELDHVQLFDWEVRALYDFISRGGRIELSLGVSGSHVHLDQSIHWELVLDVLLGLLALTSEFLAFLNGHGLIVYWGGTRKWFNSDVWDIVTAVTDICIFASILLEFGDYLGLNHEKRYLIVNISGVACMLAWSKIIEHLEPIQPYRTLILAMRRGVPVVARFVVGSAPLLMGFAGLGMALFSEHSGKFASLENSVITLFSILNGDVLLETAKEIRPAGVVGDIFLVAFVCIFVYSGLNVFISIIQDAYAAAKEQTAVPHPTRLGGSRGSTPDLRRWDSEDTTSLEAPTAVAWRRWNRVYTTSLAEPRHCADTTSLEAPTAVAHDQPPPSASLSPAELRLLMERLANLDEQLRDIRSLQRELVTDTWRRTGSLSIADGAGSDDLIGLGVSPGKEEFGRHFVATSTHGGSLEQGGFNSHLQHRSASHQRSAIGVSPSPNSMGVSGTHGLSGGAHGVAMEGFQRQNSYGSLSRVAHSLIAGIATGVTSPPESLSPRHKIL